MRVVIAGVVSTFSGLFAGLVLGLVLAGLIVPRSGDAFTVAANQLVFGLVTMVVGGAAVGVLGVRSALRQRPPDAQAADYDESPPAPRPPSDSGGRSTPHAR
jgi:hypothetical protein